MQTAESKITVAITVISDTWHAGAAIGSSETWQIEVDAGSSQTWHVEAAAGSSLYKCMQNLQDKDVGFRFEATLYPDLGEFITSINGKKADPKKHQYWEIKESDGKRLTKGVSDTFPKDGDGFIFCLAIYSEL